MEYDKDYFASESIKDNSFLLKYIRLIEQSGIVLKDKTIIDIGCANGEFIKLLSNSNHCYGIDISEIAINNAKNQNPMISKNIYHHDISSTPLKINEPFDIIVMFDVIEHLYNFQYLKEFIEKNLKSDGVIIITTPNAHSLQRWIVGNQRFIGEQDPTHTLLFSAYTLDFFLRRLSLQKKELFCGFSFYLKNNFLTRTFPLGAQVFAIYEK